MKSGYTLVWGKTYPELSTKYIEGVCTAGVLESGKPVRLYPIRYRYISRERFGLYQWINAGIQKNPQDSHPESHKIDCDSTTVREKLPTTKDGWGKRAEFMFTDKSWQFETVDELQEAQKANRTSIGSSLLEKSCLSKRLIDQRRMHTVPRRNLKNSRRLSMHNGLKTSE